MLRWQCISVISGHVYVRTTSQDHLPKAYSNPELVATRTASGRGVEFLGVVRFAALFLVVVCRVCVTFISRSKDPGAVVGHVVGVGHRLVGGFVIRHGRVLVQFCGDAANLEAEAVELACGGRGVGVGLGVGFPFKCGVASLSAVALKWPLHRQLLQMFSTALHAFLRSCGFPAWAFPSQ